MRKYNTTARFLLKWYDHIFVAERSATKPLNSS